MKYGPEGGGVINSNPCPRHQIGPINFSFKKTKVYTCPGTEKKSERDSDILKWFSGVGSEKKVDSLYKFQWWKSSKIDGFDTFFTFDPQKTISKCRNHASTRIGVYFELLSTQNEVMTGIVKILTMRLRKTTQKLYSN